MDMILEVLEGDTAVKTLRFDANPSAQVIKIGRVASATIRFEHDDQVSRLHAVIEWNHDGVFIIDLGSVLGTYVNGEKITKRKLKSGDIITVGRQKLRLTIHVDPLN
jgi:pSer/pThr/pTyr-binding forkhead associated (FHA) protein